MSFTFLTVALPFDGTRIAAVDETLATEGREAYRGGRVRNNLRGKGVHFLSITTVPEGGGSGAFLVLESSHDGDARTAIRTLADNLSDSLMAIFDAAGIRVSAGNIAGLLRSHSIQTGTGLFSVPGLNHRGIPGMTVDRIFREEDFANRLRDLVVADRSGGSQLRRLRAIRETVAKDEANADMMVTDDVAFLYPVRKTPFGPATLLGLVGRGIVNFAGPGLIVAALTTLLAGVWIGATSGPWAGIGMAALVLVLWALVLIAVAGVIYAGLRRQETNVAPDDSAPDYKVLSDVMGIENDGDVNHLAGISVMKAGWLRQFTLRLAFWFVGELAATRFRPGFLGELGTIHSARWVLLPGTDKLLFFSNFSGSWESYLEDFITKASNGLTGVWSNTEGFPRTSNLFFDGATDGDRFKRWARRQQRPSWFWYRAYPNKTAHTVRLNAAIRHGLLTAATEDEAAAWFDLFGSCQRRAASLQTDEIQKILFGGMGSLRDGVCHLIRLPEEPNAARDWLRKVEPLVSYGDDKPGETATILALTATGLGRFGLTEAELATFPAAFRQGMAEPRRARSVLMDTGDDKPASWNWGQPEKPVDVALYVLSRVPDERKKNSAETHASEIVEALKESGGTVVATVETERLPKDGPVREPFGFVDGISQPILRGIPRWSTNQNSRDVVEPGEFILGYPDNRGFLPPSPRVAATADPANRLPAVDTDIADAAWPDFRRSTANADRDLGRNGSYLVIREMEQDVGRFHQQALDLADRLADHPARPHGLSREQFATWITAKSVGRWPDGSSLTRHPFEPASGWDGETPIAPDNDFLHGLEDPDGKRCPYSAHIRRSNPRESFEPGSDEQLSIVNRHRILRVGRPYARGRGASRKRGLLFLCLNGDLERQFEFVQQTWAMSRQFHGLTDEVDAIVGRGGKGGQLTIPTSYGPMFAQGFNDVVRIRGGAYFFLPSRSAVAFLAGLTDGGSGG
ncbi:hypothetical protein [Tropicimonas sp. IMCC34043]|uniref:Dyp-type peroxidase n=1 Tax=Tropicimonas sp. IMCC34043 TaxID=2248760 RepID=UPI000E28876F|nr:hypothetical protein [Tropicimonas sp. IMCC34043]